MSRVRRIMFLVFMVALIGASSTGLSRSACGTEIEGGDSLGAGNEARDFATGECVDSNGSCGGSVGGGVGGGRVY